MVGLDAELKYTAGLVSAACFAATGPTVPSNNIAGLGLGGQLPNVLAKDLSKKKMVWQWKVGQLFLLLSISVAKVPNPKDTWLLGDMLDP